jgi:hypothetical protein
LVGIQRYLISILEKAQSKTLDSVIIDLNLWPGMHLSFEKLNVALSRVKTRNDIRLMPVLPGQNLDHIYSLRPDPRMLVWRAGFGPDGMWDPERSKAAMDLLPADFFKKQNKKGPTKNGSQHLSRAMMKAILTGVNMEENTPMSQAKKTLRPPKKAKTAQAAKIAVP